MSYSLTIYRREVRDAVERGEDLEEIDAPEFDPALVTAFTGALLSIGYKGAGVGAKEYVKDVEGCPVEVSVWPDEIGVTVPYRQNSEEAIFTALQDMAEICDADVLAIWDPQDEEWVS